MKVGNFLQLMCQIKNRDRTTYFIDKSELPVKRVT